MDTLSVWYSSGPECVKLYQVQIQMLLGFIGQDNLQVGCFSIRVVQYAAGVAVRKLVIKLEDLGDSNPHLGFAELL